MTFDEWNDSSDSERLKAYSQLRVDYQQACKTIAEMHAAAVGEIRGPTRGVVEDVADLRAEVERLRALLKRARPRVESFAFTTKYEKEAKIARELARDIRGELAAHTVPSPRTDLGERDGH